MQEISTLSLVLLGVALAGGLFLWLLDHRLTNPYAHKDARKRAYDEMYGNVVKNETDKVA